MIVSGESLKDLYTSVDWFCKNVFKSFQLGYANLKVMIRCKQEERIYEFLTDEL